MPSWSSNSPVSPIPPCGRGREVDYTGVEYDCEVESEDEFDEFGRGVGLVVVVVAVCGVESEIELKCDRES